MEKLFLNKISQHIRSSREMQDDLADLSKKGDENILIFRQEVANAVVFNGMRQGDRVSLAQCTQEVGHYVLHGGAATLLPLPSDVNIKKYAKLMMKEKPGVELARRLFMLYAHNGFIFFTTFLESIKDYCNTTKKIEDKEYAKSLIIGTIPAFIESSAAFALNLDHRHHLPVCLKALSIFSFSSKDTAVLLKLVEFIHKRPEGSSFLFLSKETLHQTVCSFLKSSVCPADWNLFSSYRGKTPPQANKPLFIAEENATYLLSINCETIMAKHPIVSLDNDCARMLRSITEVMQDSNAKLGLKSILLLNASSQEFTILFISSCEDGIHRKRINHLLEELINFYTEAKLHTPEISNESVKICLDALLLDDSMTPHHASRATTRSARSKI